MNDENVAGAVSLKILAERKLEWIGKTTQFKIDPRKLEVEDGFNARIPGDELDAHIAAMKESFKAGATIPAIDVRVDDGRVIVVDGHCRRRAILELIAEGVEIESVDIRQYRGNDAERVAHMLTSAQGKPLTPLECGKSYLRLIRFGWTKPAIASRVGKSISHVEQMILLAESNSDVQAMVAGKSVSAAVAVEMVRKHGENAGPVLQNHLDTAKAGGKKKVTQKTISAASQKPSDLKYEMRVSGPDDVICFRDELEALRLANSINKQYLQDRIANP